MPGRGSYGPGGKWIYSRAARLRKKNPDMDESTSFAIATQQAHKVGKSPKSFRTPEGVAVAKAKMPGPVKEYRKTASLAGFFDEMDKIAAVPNSLKFLLGFLLGRNVWNKADEKEKRKHAEAIPGGRAAGRPDSDFDPKQLVAGIKVEMEHTKSLNVAKEIAKDHLAESPSYYKALKVMEGVLEKKANGDEEEESVDRSKKAPMGKVLEFFRKNPKPSDDSVHDLAEGFGVSPHTLEEQIYQSFGSLLQKKAAMGLDLRMNGPGNVKRPPFATEGSKGLARKNFNQSRKIGTIAAVKAPTPAPRAAATML